MNANEGVRYYNGPLSPTGTYWEDRKGRPRPVYGNIQDGKEPSCIFAAGAIIGITVLIAILLTGFGRW